MPRSYESLWHRLCAHVEVCEFTGCWNWVGTTRRHGGGHRPALTKWIPEIGARQHNAARLMCELIHGAPPNDGQLWEASHLCDESNWLCVCPDHLIWETKRENMARMWAARRNEQLLDLDLPGHRPGTLEAPW